MSRAKLYLVRDEPGEQWKRIPGFSSYEASNLGRVRSWRPRNGITPVNHPKLLTPVPSKDGHLRTLLRDDSGARRCVYVHALVLTAFVGPRPDWATDVRHHPDPDPTNNRVENLIWGTQLQNAADREAGPRHCRGENNGHAKLTAADVRAIIASPESHGAIALKYGIARGYVSQLKRGRHWRSAL